MRSVHVAVQLRSPTFGESSGVVSQLLALGRPVVVSGAGSFAELPPELAGCVPADCSPDALVTAIEAAETTEESDRRRQELLTARSPKAFADRTLEIFRLPLAEVSWRDGDRAE